MNAHPQLSARLLAEIQRWPIFDCHTHINPHEPAARHWDQILGYHYYTEQVHAAGMPAEDAAHDLDPDDRCRRIARHLDQIKNTEPYAWLLEIVRVFHGLHVDRIGPHEVEKLIPLANQERNPQAWDHKVWQQSNIECVFLTNDFDDPLTGFDTRKFVPCLRTDDLVLKLHHKRTVERLQHAAKIELNDLTTLRNALASLFERFVQKGARACAISLPPSFQPVRPTPVATSTPLRRALKGLDLRPEESAAVSSLVFWTLAELAQDHKLPFDLMIGPVRDAYPHGVAGGRDLFDRRVSLADYRELFAHFRNLAFPVSTLSPDAADELVAYSWIFPNVFPLGHWWYSNLPAYISTHLRARLQGIPWPKILGYYSDAYKLEFVLPKFQMYRRILAEVLAEEWVVRRGRSETEALDLARSFLIDNPRRVFPEPA
jgi:glucuronate isomerase